MPVPEPLSDAALEALTDPAALLARAWALEPALRVTERAAVLERLDRLLEDAPWTPAPPGRAWRLELLAERAIDASIAAGLDEAEALADLVLAEAHADHEIAIARALFARGRALAWRGTETTSRRADDVLLEAAERFARLGAEDWRGAVVFWRGYAIFFQNGDLSRGIELMREALAVLDPDGPRRPTVLGFLADAVAAVGEFEDAETLIAEATELADRHGDLKSRAYASWSRARIASQRGDALLAERLLREVERDAADWFDLYTGVAFLADAAEMLDRVGLDDRAAAYLARARARDPDNEFVHQAQATLLARSGNPHDGLEALQRLAEGEWLEKRLIWRHTLLTAWATFRAGRHGAGELARRALAQADACGGPAVARSGEPLLVSALAPPAQRAGSSHARELLLDGRTLLVRLFGAPEVTRADGTPVTLPTGKPGELVRMLALHERGLPVEVVLESFFPGAPPAAARQRLRQVLTRLRAVAGEIVLRDGAGDGLRLAPAWVDVREFLAAAERVRGVRGPRAVALSYAALALHDGPPLAGDRYAEWARPTLDLVEYRHIGLLDLIAADAAARGSHEEALTALDAAALADPLDAGRDARRAEEIAALGRAGTAGLLARRARPAP